MPDRRAARMQENPPAYISVTDSRITLKFVHCPFVPPKQPRAVRINKWYYRVPSQGNDIREYKEKSHVKGDNIASIRKSFNRLKAIINCNCEDVTTVKFLTLTYEENVTDSKVLYSDMKYFCRKLRDNVSDHFEYLYVKERQGRGAWHVHMFLFFDDVAPWIDENDVTAIWGHGYCDVKAIEGDINNVGNYLCAYLTDADGGSKKGARLLNYESGIRLYNCSRGVKRPVKYSVTYAEYCEMVNDSDMVAVSSSSKDMLLTGGHVATFKHEIYRRI
jgi:hypothetical protein